MPKFQLGEATPNFTLPSTTGETFSFEQHQKDNQGWHLLIFFRGSWCPVCVEDLQNLQESIGFFEGKNVHITTVSTDKLDDLKAMKEEHGFTYPVLADEELQALEAFDVHYHREDDPYEDHGAHGEPAYFLIDENGKLLYQQRQTSPFGRPTVTDLRKVVQYINSQKK
ncbi:peroxiredoxin [Pontibacillus halophilus JSM 076056 = DSM 19796]|uniref:Peroxiredoxin n=1 Tax=Pontibacillus halophilus JSM 076056 = DSM 19796 TaxID=1385510 RepID=A0A0A5GH46_9BACI|nr:redoxin domain-containing protein [Pontibacillus halophilus]KGX90513.1 peroxiredoxin [Pontibacillus halophilus JSM 076056 = DSM 19796]